MEASGPLEACFPVHGPKPALISTRGWYLYVELDLFSNGFILSASNKQAVNGKTEFRG